jgi:hypothetical protein
MGRFPKRETGGIRVSGWETQALSRFGLRFYPIDISSLTSICVLATVVQASFPQEAAMIERTILLHYRRIGDVVTTLLAFGTALLLGQLIVWARL